LALAIGPVRRPFTGGQALENQASPKALRRTGNIRLAARGRGGPRWRWIVPKGP
jgi:hypothetical protein